jgi:hypothetical protein
MANEAGFAAELNALIKKYIEEGAEPQDIVDELARESHLIFGQYNLEIYMEAKPLTRD